MAKHCPLLLMFTAQHNFEEGALENLRRALFCVPVLSPLIDSLCGLEALYEQVTRIALCREPRADTQVLLHHVTQWIRFGATSRIKLPIPACLACPLTFLEQLASYVDLVDRFAQGRASTWAEQHSLLLNRMSVDGIQGLCVGFSTACVIAAARSPEDVTALGANMIRLLFCAGLVADEGDKDLHPDSTIYLSVSVPSSRPGLSHETILQLIQSLCETVGETYIATVFDSNSITVATRTSKSEAITNELSKNGLLARRLKISGHFHDSRQGERFHKILNFCETRLDIRLPWSSQLQVALRSNINGQILSNVSLSEELLRALLVERADWNRVLSNSYPKYEDTRATIQTIFFGHSNPLPASLRHRLSCGAINAKFQAQYVDDFPKILPRPLSTQCCAVAQSKDAYAVIGMACNFPGAPNLDSFWHLLSSKRSMHLRVGDERFSMHRHQVQRGQVHSQAYWGNFLSDYSAFDSSFFRRSPREASSMDPQQRLLLGAVYSALEDSGYFKRPNPDRNVGCFIGVGSVDYCENVNTTSPDCFSAVGTLRAFITGRLSHFFGWSGPSVTFDTACSSSAVAIHAACRSLIHGECSMAIAGGVNIFTSPAMFENLGAGGFLSPTGPCKSFDATADGYCRGEGLGIVVLRLQSSALRDVDNIQGLIMSTAVNQNTNVVPITVPHQESLSQLYRRLLSAAHVMSSQVSYVEAHGTGTPIGDPVELNSIGAVFYDNRHDKLRVGSVKANIGHTEAASGVAGLIKVILMMKNGYIPGQANFSRLNPNVEDGIREKITIMAEQSPWDSPFRIACVNNYGAAGSNAALLVCETRRLRRNGPGRVPAPQQSSYPFIIRSRTAAKLQQLCASLNEWVVEQSIDDVKPFSLDSLSYILAGRANSSLTEVAAFSASSITELSDHLIRLRDSYKDLKPKSVASPSYRTILCFGGQDRPRMAISDDLYSSCAVFRYHLDQCDLFCRSLGLESLYPAIFQAIQPTNNDVIVDVVQDQISIFAIQYATAMSWIDCGLKPDALVGHSLGELTAVCVSGMLSLEDGIRLVAGRASIFRDHFGPERGAMAAVQSSKQSLRQTLRQIFGDKGHEHSLEIACFNGHDQFVVSGKECHIRELEDLFLRNRCFQSISKFKRLKATFAFHSRLTEPLLDKLEQLASTLAFRPPKYNLVSCVDGASGKTWQSKTVAQHTRSPVLFVDALRTLGSDNWMGSNVWIEAGSESSVIPMIRRHQKAAFASCSDKFITSDLGRPAFSRNITNQTVELWQSNVAVQYWYHYQRADADHLGLSPPGYVFENACHWMKHGSLLREIPIETSNSDPKWFSDMLFCEKRERGIWTVRCKTAATILTAYAEGHIVLGFGIVPASVIVKLVIEAARLALGWEPSSFLTSTVQDLRMHAPLRKEDLPHIFLKLRSKGELKTAFEFSLKSSHQRGSNESENATGQVFLSPYLDPLRNPSGDMPVRPHRPSLRDDNGEALEIVQGRTVYKLFSTVVDYTDQYKGLQYVAGRGDKVLAKIKLSCPQSWSPCLTQPLLWDNVLQAAGLYVNCMLQPEQGQIYLASEIGKWVCACSASQSTNLRDLTIKITQVSKKNVTCDILSLNVELDEFYEIASNVRFNKVATSALKSILKNKQETVSRFDALASPSNFDANERLSKRDGHTLRSVTPIDNSEELNNRTRDLNPIDRDVKKMMSRLTGVDLESINDDCKLAELGVDSLLFPELCADINASYGLDLMKIVSDETTVVHIQSKIQEELSNQSPTIVAGKRGIKTTFEERTLFQSVEKSSMAAQQDCNVVLANATGKSITSVIEKPIFQGIFAGVKNLFDHFGAIYGLQTFDSEVRHRQTDLVLRHIVEIFRRLGCDLANASEGSKLPDIECISKYERLKARLWKHLETAKLVEERGDSRFKSSTRLPDYSADWLYQSSVKKYPEFAREFQLLHRAAAGLAECLTGESEGIKVLFGDKAIRTLVEDVYVEAPIFRTGNHVLAEFLERCLSHHAFKGESLKILEIGAGTGATTKKLLNLFQNSGIPIQYTFTDISPSLVAAARKTFSNHTCINFQVLDIEKPPNAEVFASQDMVIATNCIHATHAIKDSLEHIRCMLADGGYVILLELTKGLPWFDLVFGLLDGWWSFKDEREHALASEIFWKRKLQLAGFEDIEWTNGESESSKTFRVIIGQSRHAVACHDSSPAETDASLPGSCGVSERWLPLKETVPFAVKDDIILYADIYYPEEVCDGSRRRPVALLIHGGGHVMLSRHDIRQTQVQILLHLGFLPISIDYRLCPEVTLDEGPMADVKQALSWVRVTLPTLQLQRMDVSVDGSRVVVIGWSTGGMLAMSSGWTAEEQEVESPSAALVFYSPTDYEAPEWSKPNIPTDSRSTIMPRKDSLQQIIEDGLEPKPITSCDIPGAIGGWLDAQNPRSLIALHMNWNAETLQVLIHGRDAFTDIESVHGVGLTKMGSMPNSQESNSKLDPESITAISPYAQIRRKRYRVPTFFIHGTCDDLIPWRQTQSTFELLRESTDCESHIAILEGEPHLFDLRFEYPQRQKMVLARLGAERAEQIASHSVTCPHDEYMTSNSHSDGDKDDDDDNDDDDGDKNKTISAEKRESDAMWAIINGYKFLAAKVGLAC